MSTMETAVWALAALMAIGALALAGIGLWVICTRRRAWREFERARRAIDKGTRI